MSLDELMFALQDARSKLGVTSHARQTTRGYAYDWKRFEAWCQSMELTALPAASQTLELYVMARLRDGRKTTAVAREVSAITAKHCAAALPSPAVAEVWNLLDSARRDGMEDCRQMLPLSIDNLHAIARKLLAKGTKQATRNRALILIGFASALRGSTLGEIRTEDLEFCAQGVVIRIRREKQDQAARGRKIGIPLGQHPATCPVRALRDWLAIRGNAPGAIFGLCCERICSIVKRCLREIGVDATNYGSHSLRAGFVTAAGEAGAGELLIAAQTGHRTMAVLRRYFRRSELFRANACSILDL